MVYLRIEVINSFLVICLQIDREYEDSILFIVRDLESHAKQCSVGGGWGVNTREPSQLAVPLAGTIHSPLLPYLFD